MDSIKDIELTFNLMKKLDSTRIYIGTDLCNHSSYWGKKEQLSKYKLFALTPSTGAMNITNDELFQKMKEFVLMTADGSKGKIRDLIE